MNLRQAKKILKRISIEGGNNKWYGTPLPKSWRKLMCMWHKANAIYNKHSGIVGRNANKWANDHVAKICKEHKEVI